MTRNLFFACCALAALCVPCEAFAQFTDPRNYTNTPVGINQIELNYAYTHGNAAIDTSLIVTGASVNLNQGTVDFTRFLGCFHRLMWVEAAVPIAGLGGSVRGTNIQASTTGVGDTSYSAGLLLKGGPALSAANFKDYKLTTTVGISLSVTAPTGVYHSNKILNLGSDRWSFKPEVGVSHPFGAGQRWAVDGYANVYFFTDNSTYRGRELLRQQPLPGLEGHLSYSFSDAVWASFDARYSFRGSTFVNGVNQNNSQQNFIFGSELNLALNDRNSLVLIFARALVHQNGPTLTGFSVRYDHTWGKMSAMASSSQ